MLEEKFESRKGLLQTSFSCSNPACKKSVLASDRYSPKAAALNNASIVGARLAGCGLHAMEVITACIGMVPPFTREMCTKHNKDISIKVCEVARCVAAAEHLHIVMGKPLDELLDVTVMGQGENIDILNGIVAIAWKTGQVLAWEVISKPYGLQDGGRHGFGRV